MYLIPSSPRISSVALITGSTLAKLRSISGKDFAFKIRSALINLVGYNFVGALILSTSVKPSKLLIRNDTADPLPDLVITAPYLLTARSTTI